MKVYKDFDICKPKILSSVNKFGFSAEHNYYNYLYKQNPYKKAIFFDFGQKKSVVALFNKKNNAWHAPGEVLAPYEERLGIFLKFLDYALLKKEAKRIFAEVSEDFKSKLFKELKGSAYNIKINYELFWPVYDMDAWNEKLSGRQWKKFRNIRNRFNNHLQIKVRNPKRIDKNALKELFFSWLRRRPDTDRVDYSYYLNAIENKFRGFEMARAVSINNEVCSISAGWKIPNSDNFYCAIGLSNYKYKDMGDFINIDDLSYLKKTGYRHVDLGGSDKSNLYFKKKFKPEKVYKTYAVSISKKIRTK